MFGKQVCGFGGDLSCELFVNKQSLKGFSVVLGNIH